MKMQVKIFTRKVKMRKYDEKTLLLMMEFDEERYQEILREEGMIQMLCKLVLKNVITIEQALDESKYTREKFLIELEAYKDEYVNNI